MAGYVELRGPPLDPLMGTKQALRIHAARVKQSDSPASEERLATSRATPTSKGRASQNGLF